MSRTRPTERIFLQTEAAYAGKLGQTIIGATRGHWIDVYAAGICMPSTGVISRHSARKLALAILEACDKSQELENKA